MSKKNIIVCGYPKSGTTWLSRLVAELVGCPLRHLDSPDKLPLEGQDRESDYDCYKSHRTLTSLVSDSRKNSFKIVYIVRDPRDVAISAAQHFQVNLLSFRHSNRIIAAVNARLGRVIPYQVKQNRMISAVLYGDASLHHWLAIPWRDHYREAQQSETLVVKYEDLLDAPRRACASVLSYLGIPKSEEQIAATISNQSFENKKSFFAEQGMQREYAFLRRGSCGYWRYELDRAQKQRFVNEIGEELRALAYAMD